MHDKRSVRVGSITLCTKCWQRDEHLADCSNAKEDWFFLELKSDPGRAIKFTPKDPEK